MTARIQGLNFRLAFYHGLQLTACNVSSLDSRIQRPQRLSRSLVSRFPNFGFEWMMAFSAARLIAGAEGWDEKAHLGAGKSARLGFLCWIFLPFGRDWDPFSTEMVYSETGRPTPGKWPKAAHTQAWQLR
jgi:hypothetical protein